MLQNVQTAALMMAAAAKEAAKATDEIKANIAWAEALIPALQQREQEMVDGVHKIMSTVIEDITEFRKRSQTLLDGLTGNGHKPEERPGEAGALKPPDALALPAALDRRNNGEGNGDR